MDRDNRLRHESMGTNYTFRDKNGNLITSNSPGLPEEEEHEDGKTTDVPGAHFEGELLLIFNQQLATYYLFPLVSCSSG